MIDLYSGDSIEVLRALLAAGKRWNYCLTSPPYFEQCWYELAGEYGLELSMWDYLGVQREVFKLVLEGLTPGGVCWVVVGDTSNNKSPIRSKSQRKSRKARDYYRRRKLQKGYLEKEPLLMPIKLAEGMREDGWVMRKLLIWDKGESSQVPKGDGPAETHEYIPMMGKPMLRYGSRPYFNTRPLKGTILRHKVASHPDHPCPFPPALARELLESATLPGATVLDPYIGSGTTALVCRELGMDCIGIDLDIAISEKEISGQQCVASLA